MNTQGKASASVLIVGGYGIVGRQIAELLSTRNPDLQLILAGRSAEAGAEAAKQIPNATAVRIDINDPDPLTALAVQPDVVLGVANDGHDRLLQSAVRRGIAYVDITRWTERMHESILRLAPANMTAPVILSSGWMAGVVATVAAADARQLSRVDSIDIDILFALKDKAGPNSIEYADRLAIPFPVQINGKVEIKAALSDPREVAFAGGRRFQTYRFDTPDQYTLLHSVGAAGVSTRITYDDRATIKTMRFLLSSGIWKVLSLSIFDGLRRSMLYNPGDGAPHEVAVETRGIDHNGKRAGLRTLIVAPLGQTYMTAVGAVSQVERALGLRGRIAAPAKTSFPEQAEDLAKGTEALREMGVNLIREYLVGIDLE